MPLYCGLKIFFFNTAAVVFDSDKGYAAALYFDSDSVSARVDGVLKKLLYSGGRAVNDLACGDEVGDLKA